MYRPRRSRPPTYPVGSSSLQQAGRFLGKLGATDIPGEAFYPLGIALHNGVVIVTDDFGKPPLLLSPLQQLD